MRITYYFPTTETLKKNPNFFNLRWLKVSCDQIAKRIKLDTAQKMLWYKELCKAHTVRSFKQVLVQYPGEFLEIPY